MWSVEQLDGRELAQPRDACSQPTLALWRTKGLSLADTLRLPEGVKRVLGKQGKA